MVWSFLISLQILQCLLILVDFSVTPKQRRRKIWNDKNILIIQNPNISLGRANLLSWEKTETELKKAKLLQSLHYSSFLHYIIPLQTFLFSPVPALQFSCYLGFTSINPLSSQSQQTFPPAPLLGFPMRQNTLYSASLRERILPKSLPFHSMFFNQLCV